ncbi:MAG: 6-phosphofructokinase [Candidatus Poribacteria bacterium]|nr:MAG: 6-phosphofructokinase [Candidatus Poribacteria bacterium]
MKIAINTGGGDAPGLNAVIRAVVNAAERKGWSVYGIREGYNGFFQPGGIRPLTTEMVRGITPLGGTILGTVNRGNPFEYPTEDGRVVDISEQVVRKFWEQGFDALIVVGGDGSFRIAKRFAEMGIPLVAVPKTIDNDVNATHVTFGFQTAVQTATECLDKLHPHAEAHRRVVCVEVMGRYCGWIALSAGVAATADVILIPEIPYDIEKVCEKIEARWRAGRRFAICVVAEGAYPKEGQMVVLKEELGREVRLGGIAAVVAEEIEKRTGRETRALSLGHLLRGGHPIAYDRVLALEYGTAAVRAIEEGAFGCMVSYDPPNMVFRPIEDGIREIKRVPLDGELIRCAREMGICLGD